MQKNNRNIKGFNTFTGLISVLFGGQTKHKQGGFTLIEVLVVVLIIGILTSIALPQYRKAVLKARTAEVISTMRTIANAMRVYYDTYNKFPTNVEDLDVTVDTSKYTFRLKTYGNNELEEKGGIYATPKDPSLYPRFEWAGVLEEQNALYCRSTEEMCNKLGKRTSPSSDYWEVPLN